MASWLRGAKEWLGLGPEHYYEDDPYEEPYEEVSAERGSPVRAVPSPRPAPAEEWGDESEGGGVRVITPPAGPAASAADRHDRQDRQERPEARERQVVRPLAPVTAKPLAVTPSGFNDAQEIADVFKRNQPVIMNLQAVDRDLRRRLIDFASGICYALGGKMDRVADQVFLLTPADVEVSVDERRRLRERSMGDEI